MEEKIKMEEKITMRYLNEKDKTEISNYFNALFLFYKNKIPDDHLNARIYQEILNLILIFDNVRFANPINKDLQIEPIVIFLNQYTSDDKIILLPHHNNDNSTVTKKKHEKNVNEILQMFLSNQNEAHKKYGEILGYYCYNQNWMNKNICRVQMEINDEFDDGSSVQITTEICEFNLFKEDYGHLDHFTQKLNNWKLTIEKYKLNCKLVGYIKFWLVDDCKDEVNEYIKQNTLLIQKLGLKITSVVTPVAPLPSDDGKKKNTRKKSTRKKSKKKN